jgi:CubicO group peptidase (beta-lactamase class C family)
LGRQVGLPGLQHKEMNTLLNVRLLKIMCVIVIMTITNCASAQWKEKVKAVDSVLTYLHERQLFNGTVLLAEKGKVIYKKAFGISGPQGNPLTTASSFNLASVSK